MATATDPALLFRMNPSPLRPDGSLSPSPVRLRDGDWHPLRRPFEIEPAQTATQWVPVPESGCAKGLGDSDLSRCGRMGSAENRRAREVAVPGDWHPLRQLPEPRPGCVQRNGSRSPIQCAPRALGTSMISDCQGETGDFPRVFSLGSSVHVNGMRARVLRVVTDTAPTDAIRHPLAVSGSG